VTIKCAVQERKDDLVQESELVLVSILNTVEDDWVEDRFGAPSWLICRGGRLDERYSPSTNWRTFTKWWRMRLFGKDKGSERKEKWPWSSHPGFPAEHFYIRRHWRLREQ
jgi:hypothetical protein